MNDQGTLLAGSFVVDGSIWDGPTTTRVLCGWRVVVWVFCFVLILALVLTTLLWMCMTRQRRYLSRTRPLAEIPYVVPHAPHALLGHLPYLGQAHNVVDGQARVVRDGASGGPLGLVTFWTVHTPTVSVLDARTMRRWLCQSSARYPSPLQARHLQRLVGPSSVLLHNGVAWKWHRTVMQQHSFVVSPSSVSSPQSSASQQEQPHESVLDEACRTFAQALVGTMVQEQQMATATRQEQEEDNQPAGWTTNALSIARRATLHVFGLAVLGHDFQCCCHCRDDEDSSSSSTSSTTNHNNSNPTKWRLALDRPVPVLDQMARLQQEYTRRLFQSSLDWSRPWLYLADQYYYDYDHNHPHGWSSTSWWNFWVADTPANRQHAQDYHDLRHTLHDIVQERQQRLQRQQQDEHTTTNDNHKDKDKDDNRTDSSPRRNNNHHRQVWLDRLLLEQQQTNSHHNDNTPPKEPQSHSSFDCGMDWNDAAAVADWLVTILFGGYDTTALAVGYTLYLLAQFPAHQEHCAHEADRVLSSGSLSHDSWHQFPYITACLWEALRLYPPATVTARSLERPVTVDLTQEDDNDDWNQEGEEEPVTTTRTRTTTARRVDDQSDPHSPSKPTTTTTKTNNNKRIVTLPPQTRILCSFYWIHRDGRNFARPLEFLPQRWVQQRRTQSHEPCHNTTRGDHSHTTNPTTTSNSSIWEPRTADPDHNQDNSVPRGDVRNHLAFSAGGRNCVGQGLALDMIPRLLAHVLQSVQVEACSGGATGSCSTDDQDDHTASRSRPSKEEEPASSSSCVAPELTLVRYGLNAVPKDGIPLVFRLRKRQGQ